MLIEIDLRVRRKVVLIILYLSGITSKDTTRILLHKHIFFDKSGRSLFFFDVILLL